MSIKCFPISALIGSLLWLLSPAMYGQSGLELDMQGDTLLCFGGQNGLIVGLPSGGVPPYSFLWSTGDTTPEVSGLAAGTYFLTLTDSAGGSLVDSAIISQPPPLTGIVVFGNPSCPGVSDGQASALPQGGTPPYSYLWSDPDMQTTKIATGLSSGFYFVTVTDGNGCTAVLFVALYDRSEPDPILVSTDAGCLGIDGSVAVDTVLGGFPPYAFQWSTTDTTMQVDGLAPGQYTVTVTDSLGCIGSDSIVVGLDTFLDLTVFVPPVPCGSDSGDVTLILNGSPPFQVILSSSPQDTILTSMDTLQINGIPTGSYTVTVTDSKSCVVTRELIIEEGDLLDLEVLVDSAGCADSSGMIQIIVKEGSGEYSFEWDPEVSDSAVASGLPSGQYGVTVTDVETGCTALAEVEVPEENGLEIEVFVDSLGCTDSTGRIEVLVSGGSGLYDYGWDPSVSDSAVASGLPSGQYGVTVTDMETGCTVSAEGKVPEPDFLQLSFMVDNISCFGGNDGAVVATVEGGTTPYQYEWNTGDTLSGLDSVSGGSYTITVTDENGCTVVGQAEVAENDQLLIEAFVKPEGCEALPKGEIQLTVTGGVPQYSFQWSIIAPDTSMLTGLEVGSYQVTVTDSLGCSDSLTILVDSSQQPLADFEVVYDPCSRDSLIVQLNDQSISQDTGMLNLQWFVNDSLTSTDSSWNFTVSDSGSYLLKLIVTNPDGCADTLTKLFDLSPLFLPLADSAVLCPGDSVQLNIGGSLAYSYQWTPAAGLDDSLGSSPLAFPDETTTYTVSIIAIQNTDTCQLVDSIAVVVADSFELFPPADTIICDAIVGLSAEATTDVDFVWTTLSGDTLATGPGVAVSPQDSAGIVITATDQFGCELSDTVQVVGGAVDVSLDSAFYFCLGESGTIQGNVTGATDSLKYLWFPQGFFNPDTTSGVLFQADSAGSFPIGVRVENLYGCSDSAETVVVVIDSSLGTTGLYYGQCEPFEVIFVNTGAPQYVLFFGDPTNPDASSDENQTSYVYPDTGTYTALLVLDPSISSGCQDTVEFEVIVRDGPFLIPSFQVSAGACTDSVTLFFEDQSIHFQDSIVEWVWLVAPQDTILFGANPVLTIGSSPIIVTLEVATSLGCTESVTDTFNFPFVTETLPDTLFLCRGDTVAMNPSGNPDFTWSWFPATGLSDPDVANPFAFPDQTTTYVAEVSQASGSDTCRITKAVTVVVRPGPVVEVPNNMVLCDGSDTVLVATSSESVQYLWAQDLAFTNPLSTDSSVLVSPQPGESVTYYLRVTDGFGCRTTDSVTVSQFGVGLFVPDSLFICFGDTILLEAINLNSGDALLYSWEFQESIITSLDSSSILIAPTTTTSYIVSATNQYGCGTQVLVTVIVDDLSLNVQATADPGIIIVGESSQLGVEGVDDDNALYMWTPPGSLDFSDVPNPLASPDSTTEYTVSVINDNGCAGQASVTVVVEFPPCEDPYVFLPNAFTPNGDGVNDVLFVRGEHIDALSLAIYNRWGQLVFETTDQSIGWDGTFKGAPAPQEVYGFVLEVNCPGGEQYKTQGNISLFR